MQRLPETFPCDIGLADIRGQGRPVLRIGCRDRDGNLNAVRLRRDFGQLLALIRAHALLHQATRDRDDDGRIIATLEDYAVVRDLVVDAIEEGVDASVSESVRETVQAVSNLISPDHPEIGLPEIARALKLDKSAASRRIATAVRLGYLHNREDRKGRPARLCLGDALPEATSVLPTVEVLHCCSVVRGDEHPPSPHRPHTPG